MSPKAKRALREALAIGIERRLALLDKIDGDPDLEPALGAAENHPGGYRDEADQSDWYAVQNHDDREDDGDDLEPSLGGPGQYCPTTGALQYDLEEDRSDFEYGGDEEPNLGWSETCGQGPKVGADISPDSYAGDPCDTGGGALQFNGDGYHEGQAMLRGLRERSPGVHVNHVRVSPALGKPYRSDPDELTIVAPGVARVGRQP